jgi:hypothetical protein
MQHPQAIVCMKVLQYECLWRVEAYVLAFLAFEPDDCEWWDSYSGRFFTRLQQIHIPSAWRPGEPQSRSGHYGDEKNSYFCARIEPRLLQCPVCSVLTIPTGTSRLLKQYRLRHKSVNRKCMQWMQKWGQGSDSHLLVTIQCCHHSLHKFLRAQVSRLLHYLKYDHRQNVQRLTDLCRTCIYQWPQLLFLLSGNELCS